MLDMWIKSTNAYILCYSILHLGNHLEEGYALFKFWNIAFVETSAKTGKNVEEMFEKLTRESRIELDLGSGYVIYCRSERNNCC